MATPSQHVLVEKLDDLRWEFVPTLTYTVPIAATRHVAASDWQPHLPCLLYGRSGTLRFEALTYHELWLGADLQPLMDCCMSVSHACLVIVVLLVAHGISPAGYAIC